MAKKFDWKKIRAEYVSGGISQRALAKKYKVSLTSISNHAIKEKWELDRQKYLHKAETKLEQKIEQKIEQKAERQAEQIADILMRQKHAADNVAFVLETLTNPDNFLAGDEDSFSVKELRALVAALKDSVAIQRDVYEKPNKVDQSRIGGDEVKEIKITFGDKDPEDYVC